MHGATIRLDTRCLIHNYVWTGWLRAFPGWWGCPDCICACYHQGPIWRPCTHLPHCLDADCEKPGSKHTDRYSALVLEVRKGVQFHPVKLSRRSRAIGVSFCASNSATDEVTHVRVRSHSPGLYLPCVYLLIVLSRSRARFKSYPTQGESFLLDWGPRAQMVRLILHELPMSRRGSDGKVSLHVTGSLAELWPQCSQWTWGTRAEGEVSWSCGHHQCVHRSLCHGGWPHISRATIQQPSARKGSQCCRWSWTLTHRI